MASPPEVEHRLVIDRLEGDLAVVEVDGGPVLDLPLWLLPAGVHEGDVITVRSVAGREGERQVSVSVALEATRLARDEAVGRLERLRARDPGGDIAL